MRLTFTICTDDIICHVESLSKLIYKTAFKIFPSHTLNDLKKQYNEFLRKK